MYSFDSRVRYSECDEHLRLSTPAILDYVQDCSMFHCEEIGHGFSYCASNDFAWFVIAWQIRIDRRPRFGERIRVSTWCYGMTATIANRCFVIEDAQGTPLVIADSLVAAVNTTTGRAGRIPQAEHAFVSNEPRPDLPPTQRKVRLAGEGEAVLEVPVTEHLIDSNRHVNNMHYIAFAERAIAMREPGFEIRTLYAQYKVPALLGDTIVAKLHPEDAGYGIDLASPEGKSFATVRMERA